MRPNLAPTAARALALSLLSLAGGCTLDTRTLSENSGSAAAPSVGEAGGSGVDPFQTPPAPIDLPICTYSGDSVAPGCETLAANAGFAKDAEDWAEEPYSIAIDWADEDASSSADSGALSVTNSMFDKVNAGLAPGGAMQCISVTPGATYDFAGDVFVPEGQGDGLTDDEHPGPFVGEAGFSLLFWQGGDCSDASPTIGSSQSTLVSEPGAWKHVAGTAIAGEGAASMSVRLLTIKSVRQYSFTALFDNVLLRQR